MKHLAKCAVAGLAFGGSILVACSNGSPSSSSGQGTGQIGVSLTVPGGITINAVHYAISGPTTTSGDVTLGSAATIDFTVGGLTAGAGYSIALSATDTSGDP